MVKKKRKSEGETCSVIRVMRGEKKGGRRGRQKDEHQIGGVPTLQNFKFIRPENLDQACRILSENRGKVKILAGGTDVMIEMRDDKLPPSIEMVMKISHLEELRFIEDDGKNIRIGDRKSTLLNSSHTDISRMPSSALK